MQYYSNNELLEKYSQNKEQIKKNSLDSFTYRVLKRLIPNEEFTQEDIKKVKKATAALIISFGVISAAYFPHLHQRDLKLAMSESVRYEMSLQDINYTNVKSYFEELKHVEPIKIIAAFGEQTGLEFVKYLGYSDLNDYAVKHGYKNYKDYVNYHLKSYESNIKNKDENDLSMGGK